MREILFLTEAQARSLYKWLRLNRYNEEQDIIFIRYDFSQEVRQVSVQLNNSHIFDFDASETGGGTVDCITLGKYFLELGIADDVLLTDDYNLIVVAALDGYRYICNAKPRTTNDLSSLDYVLKYSGKDTLASLIHTHQMNCNYIELPFEASFENLTDKENYILNKGLQVAIWINNAPFYKPNDACVLVHRFISYGLIVSRIECWSTYDEGYFNSFIYGPEFGEENHIWLKDAFEQLLSQYKSAARKKSIDAPPVFGFKIIA